LWDAWDDSNGGVNNLKIFNHGRLVQPSDVNLSSSSGSFANAYIWLDILHP
jgi:inositol-pentakisphosphate 2-kinase